MSAESAQSSIILVAIFGSIVVWIWLWFHRQRTGSFVRWEPRQPVPWGALGLALAFLYSSLLIAEALMQGPEQSDAATFQSPGDFAWYTWSVSIIALILIGISQAWLWGIHRATCPDLGWPTHWKILWDDIRLGLIGSTAMIGPVYLLLYLLVDCFNWTTSHPLIEQIQDEPRLDSLVAIAFSAVIQAPIFEELLYRQLAQGWLERISDEMSLPQRDLTPPILQEDESAAVPSVALSLALAEPSAEPPDRLANGPPGRWWPILVSSTLFALAHLGHGCAPIPLFLLALVLGYLYQRTHRILPCIVLHMVFNAFALVLLGFQIL